MVAKMTKGGLFSYLRAYLTNITPYKLFIRLFFVEKQKLVVHPHKNVQRVFFIYIGSFDTPSLFLMLYKTRMQCPCEAWFVSCAVFVVLLQGSSLKKGPRDAVLSPPRHGTARRVRR